MGIMVSWILDAVAFGSQLMDFQMGFSFVQTVDPVTAHPISVTGTLMAQLTLMFMFISGLHHQMILALVESYRIVPMGSGLPGKPLVIVMVVGQIFVRGLQLAFPILLTLFLVDVLQGIAGKFMPQLQLMQLAFPFKIAIGLAVLGLILRQFSVWVEILMESAPREALKLLG
jgi:flagellar biosynthetic protein FliR